jgi:Lipocalin-like domain
MMKRTGVSKVAGTLVLGAALALTRSADAEQNGVRSQSATLAGVWTLVLVDNVQADGRRIQLYGPAPQGLLMLDADGHYSLQIYRVGRAPFASNDKSKATPEENRTAIQGANAHFGRFAIDATDGTIAFRIEHASFPNWEGTEQKRSFTLDGDRLRYVVPTPTTGGEVVTGEVEWKRVR